MKSNVRTALFLAGFAVIATIPRCESNVVPKKCSQPTDLFYAHEVLCTKYYQCVHGTPLERDCGAGAVFNDQLNTCVGVGSDIDICKRDPEKECATGKIDFIPHSKHCQRYYNCSDKPWNLLRGLGVYERECSYPKLFDINEKQCVDPDKAVCGPGRVPATWECQYVANQCQSAHCYPCPLRFPSCVGKSDGIWGVPEKPWSPYYMTCKSQRSKREYCPGHEQSETLMIFNPDLKKCVTVYEVPNLGKNPNCAGKLPGHYVADRLVSYLCPGENLLVCDPPLAIDPGTKKCKPLIIS